MGKDKKKKVYVVDKFLCNGCKKCIKKCEYKAISLKDEKAEINAELCKKCGDCVKCCKQEAISKIKLKL